MYQYLKYVKKAENQDEVMNILQPIFETDIFNTQAIKENLKLLDKIRVLGENEVYERVRQDLKEDPVYKEIML